MIDDINVKVESLDDKTAIMHLEGDITLPAKKTIDDVYDGILKEGKSTIIINIRESDYINSSGIAIFLGIVTKAQRQDSHVVLAIESTHFQKIFFQAGLTLYVDVVTTLEEAKAKVRNK